MSEPFLGEIRMFGGNFAPVGWALCNGQLMPISENDALFALIGTTYGGDGETTFALPDLQSRAPVHQGPGYVLGQQAGVESVTLTTAQMPAHSHPLVAIDATPTEVTPANNLTGEPSKRIYVAPSAVAPMAAQAIGPTGGSQPHENMSPFVVITFIISLFGLFPPPS